MAKFEIHEAEMYEEGNWVFQVWDGCKHIEDFDTREEAEEFIKKQTV